MVLLPKSRMAAGKGRMIAIPISAQDIMNSLKQMPRMPTEAGLVPVKLKRKKVYKGAERKEQIRPEVIFEALRYLRKAGHPFYQFYDDYDTYMARCKIKDQRGLHLFASDDIEEDLGKPDTPEDMEVEDQAVQESEAEEEGEDAVENALQEEEKDLSLIHI